MALKDIWKNKVDGIDDVVADDVNDLAHAIIDNEIANAKLAALTNQIQSDMKNVASKVNDLESNMFDIENEIEELENFKAGAIIVGSAASPSITISNPGTESFHKLTVLGNTKQLKSTGKNLIPFPYYDGKTKIINGLTFTQNDDGGVTISGTATAKTTYTLMSDYGFVSNFISPGTYTISTGSDIASDRTVFVQAKIDYNNKANYVYFQDIGTPVKTTTIPDGVTDAHITIVNLVVSAGYTAENITIYPMLEKGSTASPYEPYTNGIPSPSPEYPQPMNSAGKDGSIGIDISNEDKSKSQALSVSTPNGLPGVPIASDGFAEYPIEHMYTDNKGNKWVCDEINFDKGVYIKRVDNMPFVHMFDGDRQNYLGINFYTAISPGNERFLPYGALCNMGHIDQYDTFPTSDNAFNLYYIETSDEGGYGTGIEFAKISDGLTKEEFSASLRGIQFLGILKEPIVTPLSEEQINAYKGIVMYKPTTNISNDDGAYLRAEYIADTKAYIDNKFAELQTAILNNI